MDDVRQTQVVRASRHSDPRSVYTRQTEAIAALLSERTVEGAAAKAGVGERVLRTWMATPAFPSDYQVARRAATSERLRWAALDAVDALIRNLTCGVPAVEVEAARAILQHAPNGSDGADAPDPPAHQRASWREGADSP